MKIKIVAIAMCIGIWLDCAPIAGIVGCSAEREKSSR